MASPNSPHPGYLQDLFEYESFLTVLRYYIDLNCFIIPSDPGDGATGWLAVHYQRRSESLFDFEKKYKFKFNWAKLTDPDYEAGVPKGKPLLLESLGFYDIFTPIRREGKRLGTVFSGAFADREPTYDHLRESWKKLTGKNASSANAEFREFVRVILETPVLEGPVLSAYGEALELFAAMMAGNQPTDSSRRIRQLMTDVFSKHFSHSYWMDWALGLPTSQAAPLWSAKVQEMDWVQSEIGIQRVPTTVITAVPAGPGGQKQDAVEDMIRIYRFQRRAFQFARQLPQAVGGRLEDYGVVFVTSADPALPRLAQRRQILETAEKIRRFASEILQGPARVGVGETVRPGEPLSESFRQAVLALHLQREAEGGLVFFQPGRTAKSEDPARLMRHFLTLKKRFEDASFSNMEEALSGFLKEVLSQSFHNPDEIRWHLYYAIVQAGEAAKGAASRGGDGALKLTAFLASELEKSATTQEMILSFKDAINRLADFVQNAGKGAEFDSMVKVRAYLEHHYQKPVKILKLAKLAGVSPATFSRRFKKANGVGLESYLQELRLSEARRLLRAGSLPVSRIAASCGFKSESYFVRLFRKKMQVSPGEYRKRG